MDLSSIHISLVICMYYLIVYCHGANHGEDCTSSDCTGKYQTCDSTNTKCRCVSGYTVNNAGNCIGELGRYCVTKENCEDPAAICTNGICACNTATHYDSNGATIGGTCTTKKSPGEQCPDPGNSGIPSTVSCMDTNSECRSSGTSYSCQCIDSFTIGNEQCVQIPVDGGWANWLDWSTCSVTCDGGSQTRTRACTNPAPQDGGSQCPGDSTETTSCNTHSCPVDGGWTNWLDWSTCSVTCDGGSRIRTRTCTNPPPQYGGSQCPDDGTETSSCKTQSCPVIPYGNQCTADVGADKCAGGNTMCSGVTCQCVDGYYWNNAACVSKVALGDTCPSGLSTSSLSCSDSNAVCTNTNNGYKCLCRSGYYDNDGITGNVGGTCEQINGGWSGWSGWSTCTVTCGGGSKIRSRTCTNPVLQPGGSQCVGVDTETGGCYTQSCPVDGGWSGWSGWSTCTKTCGGGSHTRTRSCINPVPQNGGSQCASVDTETGGCYTQSCPVIPHGDQCTTDVETDLCAGVNTECREGTCQCVAAGETSTTTVSRYECQSSLDMKAVIVGVVLGLVILILVLYSGFVTLKVRRSIANNEQLRQAELNTKLQPTYMNDVFQNVTMPDTQVEGTENLAAEYTTLSDETREAKSTYDIIRVQNDSV